MNTPHKWAKEICHLANGGEVEAHKIGCVHEGWFKGFSLLLFSNPDFEFRIKPERVYPVTSLTDEELNELYYEHLHPSATFIEILRRVINAAIKKCIIDTEK